MYHALTMCQKITLVWNVLLIACLLTLCAGGINGQQQQEHQPVVNRGVIVGKSLVLPCGLPQDKKVAPVTWVDFVHNLDENPITIFDGKTVVASHPHADRYVVSKDYSLTITNVTDLDPGEYVCRSQSGNTLNSASYIVLVADLPMCTGETSLDEGDPLLLTCQTYYWGSPHPDIRWYAGSELVTNFVDKSVISEALYVVEGKARWQDDKLPYQCRVSLDGFDAHCEKLMRVTYTVRNLQLGPVDSTSVPVGGFVACSANGNPEPVVTLTLKAMGLTETGSGMQRILVADNWVGKNLTFDCEARNTVPGKDETVVSSTVSLQIEEKTTTTTTTTTTKRPSPPKSGHTVTVSSSESELKAASAGNMTGVVIGIIIAVLVIIVIIIAVVCMKKRNQDKKRAASAGQKSASARTDEIRKMEGGGKKEESQPLTSKNEGNASVSVNGGNSKAHYNNTAAKA